MLYDCPECALPCTVEPRGTCAGTDGPVEMVYVRCANRHWFLGPADRLRRLVPPAGATRENAPKH